MDIIGLALQQVDDGQRRSERMERKPNAYKSDISKEDIGAAISLLGMRHQSGPKTSTPINLMVYQYPRLDSDKENSKEQKLFQNNCLETPLTPLQPIARRCVRRNIMHELLDLEDESL